MENLLAGGLAGSDTVKCYANRNSLATCCTLV